MTFKHVGIITGGAQPQSQINVDHAKDIGSVLEDDYVISYYDLSSHKDMYALIENKKKGKLDIVFNNACGKQGGDGTIEGFLEILGIPFVGSDTLATAMAFDKKSTKRIAASIGIPVIQDVVLSHQRFIGGEELDAARVTRELGYPVVVKASQGSDSIGTSMVKTQEEIIPSLKRAFTQDDHVLVEKFVDRKAEVTCMVFGNGHNVTPFEPIEFVYDSELLDVEGRKALTYGIPKLPAKVLEEVKLYAFRMHLALGCADYSRCDFLVDKANRVYFLELNGHAGLGKSSSTTFIAKHTKGWSYAKMIKEILKTAIKRYK